MGKATDGHMQRISAGGSAHQAQPHKQQRKPGNPTQPNRRTKRRCNPVPSFLFRREKIILDNSRVRRYKHSELYKYSETNFYLNYTHTIDSSRFQNQICTTLCSMDNRTGKHSAKALRIDA